MIAISIIEDEKPPIRKTDILKIEKELNLSSKPMIWPASGSKRKMVPSYRQLGSKRGKSPRTYKEKIA